jgi:excisionase family DNA binding protein
LAAANITIISLASVISVIAVIRLSSLYRISNQARIETMNDVLDRPDTVVPTESDAELATKASRVLARGSATATTLRVKLEDGEELVLPQSAARLLGHLLTEMAQGNAVTLIPVHAELTTQEAADYLNISRPYLIQLLEAGEIQFHKVGSHRRVKFSHLAEFSKQKALASQEKKDELVKQAQELGMGY